jgi:hypothetical protein
MSLFSAPKSNANKHMPPFGLSRLQCYRMSCLAPISVKSLEAVRGFGATGKRSVLTQVVGLGKRSCWALLLGSEFDSKERPGE